MLAEATETKSISEEKNPITIAASGSRSDNFGSSKEIQKRINAIVCSLRTKPYLSN